MNSGKAFQRDTQLRVAAQPNKLKSDFKPRGVCAL